MAGAGDGLVSASSAAEGGPETGHPAGAESLLSLRGIRKSFSGITVLDGVSFDLAPGEVHILAGENGAGKSTLIKIIAGVYTEYEGEMLLGGRPAAITSPHHAAELGISVIHQEMSLVDPMSAVDNLFLGREIASRGIWLDKKSQHAKAREFCSRLDLDIDLSKPVEEFPLSVKNRLEIAKALAIKARIIIMDEPTSALSGPEVEKLFSIISELKKSGCGIIYITHRMDEIYRIADRITVLRDGRYVGTAPAAELGEDELVKWMIGRELKAQFPERAEPGTSAAGAERFKVEGFSVPKPREGKSDGVQRWLAKDIGFSVKPGEILGFAGLQGSGNSDLFSGLFGVYGGSVSGRVLLDGAPFRVSSPKRSIAQGMAYLTNDRKGNGLVLGMDIVQNITLASLPAVSPAGWFRPALEDSAARRNMEALRIKASGGRQEVGTLSGGNQQKVALAKWLETGPRIMLLDEPTRGVDIGAKHEIYRHMNEWTKRGISILLITSEMPELLGLSDRIIVMHRGEMTAEFGRGTATQEKILRAAMGRSA
ncbi:MAG TPA: sugar ABC transporter ATP-binding protein [Elusimicrobiales bacterium]|nr:sugar ABC transporter ATP-binding protein [Elusimicrobiales bacterium]